VPVAEVDAGDETAHRREGQQIRRAPAAASRPARAAGLLYDRTRGHEFRDDECARALRQAHQPRQLGSAERAVLAQHHEHLRAGSVMSPAPKPERRRRPHEVNVSTDLELDQSPSQNARPHCIARGVPVS
jgi:hypothetical protein